MSKKACKCAEVECEECPEWIFTLADLIMCMMGLFVILWVLKPAPGKMGSDNPAQAGLDDPWLETVAGIRVGFNYEPNPDSDDPVDQIILRKRQRLNGPGDGGPTNRPRKGAEGTDPEVQTIRPGQQATVGGRVLFDPGLASLTRQGTQELDQIAQQIRGYRLIVLVKGHTSLDDLGDAATAEQKMDLSVRRAQAAADYLTSRGVEPDILRVQGCSTYEPVVQRAYTANAQASNRRVEVEATSTRVAERQDPPTPRHPASTSSPTDPGTRPHAFPAADGDAAAHH